MEGNFYCATLKIYFKEHCMSLTVTENALLGLRRRTKHKL